MEVMVTVEPRFPIKQSSANSLVILTSSKGLVIRWYHLAHQTDLGAFRDAVYVSVVFRYYAGIGERVSVSALTLTANVTNLGTV